MPCSSPRSIRAFGLILALTALILSPGCAKQYGGLSTEMTITSRVPVGYVYALPYSDWNVNGGEDLLKPENHDELKRLCSRAQAEVPASLRLHRGYQYMFIFKHTTPDGEDEYRAVGPRTVAGESDTYDYSG